MPRTLAANVLEDIFSRKQPFEKAFSDRTSCTELNPRDRAFAYQLISTSLRRLGQIDDLIDRCLKKPLPKRAAGAKTVLRLGTAQLLFLNVPPYAAVDTSVELAQGRQQGPYKKMINAVLRRLSQEGAEIVKLQERAKLNTPDWLWRSWSTAYGLEVCQGIAEAHLYQPPLDLTPKEDPAGWAKRLSGQVLPFGSIRLADHVKISSLAGFQEGAWWVQDVASSLPVKLLGKIDGEEVADLCAAPGGKTAQLVAGGAKVVAIDRSAQRINTLEQNLERLGLKAKTIVTDAIKWRPDKPLDAVLIDAPCIATGTIRRHPDVQWLKSPENIIGTNAIQRALLASATEIVKRGGKVMFVTCSIQPEEGPDIVDTFLDSGAPFFRKRIIPEEVGGNANLLTVKGDLRTLPCHMSELGGMDGFYAARLVRT